MKHQQNQLASKRNFIRIAALVLMLALTVCCMVVFANADPVVENYRGSHDHMPAYGDTGFRLGENGKWVKTYDGTTGIGDRYMEVTVDGQTVKAKDVQFNNANVGEATYITVTYELDGKTYVSDPLPAEIRPAQLNWSGVGTVTVPYNPANTYTGKVTLGENDSLVGVLEGDVVNITNKDSLVANFSAQGIVTGEATAQLLLDNSNYVVNPLKVQYTVTPASITEITWSVGDTIPFADITNIKALGNGTIPMTVQVLDGEEELSLADITAAGTYTLKVKVPNGLYAIADDVVLTKEITITKASYTVVLNDGSFVDNGDLVNPNVGFGYHLVAEGKDGAFVPDWVLSAITYEYKDAQGNKVAKVTKPGVYTVTAIAPQLDNVDVIIEKATATLTVIANYRVIETEDGAIIIVGKEGVPASVETKLSVPEKFARVTVRGLTVYKAYTLTVNNAEGLTFSVRIPVSTAFTADKNCYPLSVGNLYIVDAEGNRVVASDKYDVKLSEDGFYYIIDGYTTAGDVTFMIAPEYDTPFWKSAIGIALLVLIALILIVVIPLIIGFALIRIEDSGRNPVISVELEGILPEFEPVVIPDKIEDPDAVIEEGLDAKVEELFAEVPAEFDEDVDTDVAVAEAMAQLDEELADIDLMAEANAATDDLADQLALGLMDEVEADDSAEISEDVQQAIADAMAENFNESADATDAIALIDEEEEVAEEVTEEESESEDDDDDSFGGFGSMPLDYIDAIAEADRYAEMLEQESRGEVQLVTRYRRSYLSRLAQSQGNIQDYYNAIKNLLLSYKGVKSRISWNFESFNVGRTPLAKFNAKTRTLYVYIAFSPEELVDSKYNFTDMSAKKKYAAVPVLIKVKGERKFKHALELITMLCEEKLQLPKKKVIEEVDYKMPFKTTEELVNEGIIKKMVAAIPVGPTLEEAAPEEVPAQEEVAVEETPVAEEVVAEAPVEEVAEETVAGDDQNA